MEKIIEIETLGENFVFTPAFVKENFKKAIIATCNEAGKSAAETERLLALSDCVKFSPVVPVECITNKQEAIMEICIGDTSTTTELSSEHAFEQALYNMVYNVSKLNMFSKQDLRQLAEELIVFKYAIQQHKLSAYKFYEQQEQNSDCYLFNEFYALIIEDSIDCWCSAGGTEFTEDLIDSERFCGVQGLALRRFVYELFGIDLVQYSLL